MAYRLCPDTTCLDDTAVDTPEMVETEAVIARGERHLRILEELADLGMVLARRIVQNANDASDASEPASDDSPARKPPAEPGKAFAAVALAVRRTVALEAKLAADVKSRRGALFAERAARGDAQFMAEHEFTDSTVTDAIEDAVRETCPDLDTDEARGLLREAQERLLDGDAFSDYLDRPPGETIAKLCAALGLDPDFCVQAGERWMTRRPPHRFEAADAHSHPFSHPSPSGEGPDAQRPGWGSAADPPTTVVGIETSPP